MNPSWRLFRSYGRIGDWWEMCLTRVYSDATMWNVMIKNDGIEAEGFGDTFRDAQMNVPEYIAYLLQTEEEVGPNDYAEYFQENI